MATQESILRILIDSRNAERNANSLNRELRSIERNGDFATTSMDSMSKSSRALATSLASVVTVGAAIAKVDAYTNLQNRLKLVTNSQEELNQAMKDTFQIAQESKQNWESVLVVYQRFADNAKELNLTMEHTASLTDTVAKAVAISGATAESAQAAIVQFGQALGSGVLRGEEFNSVMEQTPALAKAIANGLGVNIGQLRALANDGKLTADVLVEALDKAKVSVDELFSRTDMTIGQSLTLLSNEVTKFAGEAGQASGGASLLAESIKTLSQNLNMIADVAIVGIVGLLTKAIVTKTMAIKSDIGVMTAQRAETLVGLQTTAQATAAEVARTGAIANLAKWQLEDARATMARMTGMQRLAYLQSTVLPLEVANTAAVEAHAAATAADTAAQNANNAARSRGAVLWAAMGGWAGVLTVGVMAAAAAYLHFTGSANDATESLASQAKSVDELVKKYKDLSFAKMSSEMASLRSEAKATTDEIKKAYASARTEIGGTLDIGTYTKAQVAQWKSLVDAVYEYNKTLGATGKSSSQVLKEMTEAGFEQSDIDNVSNYFKAMDEGSVSLDKTNGLLKFGSELLGLSTSRMDDYSSKVADLRSNLSILNSDYESSNSLLKNQIDLAEQYALLNGASEKSIVELSSAVDAYSNGTITASALATEFAEKANLPQDVLNKFLTMASNVDTSKVALDKAVAELKRVQANAPNAARGFDDIGNSADGASGKVDKLTAATKKYNQELKQEAYDSAYIQFLKESRGYTDELAKSTLEAQKAAGGRGARIDANTKSLLKEAEAGRASLEAYDQSIEDRKKADEDANKKRLKDQEDADKKRKKLEEERYDLSVELGKKYATVEARQEVELQEELKRIRFAYAKDKTLMEEKTKQAKTLFAGEKRLREMELQRELNEHKWTNEQKLAYDLMYESQSLSLSLDYTKEQNAQRVNALKERLAIEHNEILLANANRVLEAKKAYMKEQDYLREKYNLESKEISAMVDKRLGAELQIQKGIELIRQGVSKGGDFLSGDRQPDRRSNLQVLDDEYADRLTAMQENFEKIKAETMRQNGDLITIEREFIEAKEQLQNEYASKISVAREQDYQNQLGVYGQMLSATGNVFSQMTTIIEGYKEENTRTYKTMFALNKALAIAQAIVNTEQGATAALAMGPLGVPLATAIRVMGYTSVGIIAAQAYHGPGGEGYATGGLIRGAGTGTSDSIPIMASNREYMIKARSVEKLGVGNLDYINKYGELPQDTARGTNTLKAIESSQNSIRSTSTANSPNVNLNPNFVIVDERQNLSDYLYSPDGTKAFVKFFKQNRNELGL